jgi:hypothetical protein
MASQQFDEHTRESRVRPGTVFLVPKMDRRNHFAREQLRRAVQNRFADDRQLALSACDAANVFQLPTALCERLLHELTARGTLEKSPNGEYIRGSRELA